MTTIARPPSLDVITLSEARPALMTTEPTTRNVAVTDPALLAALTTEHYTLQSARASTITEANGRSQLFLSTVSGATVALALAAQLDRIGDTFTMFAATVLPALMLLGITSYVRLADLAVNDAYYARAIGRIRSFYFGIDPAARNYWLLPAGDDPHAVMRQSGQRHTRWHHLGHAATAIGAVNAVLGGVLAGLIVSRATPWPMGAVLVPAVVVGVTLLVVFLADQTRRWNRGNEATESLFLPDGSARLG